MYSLPGWQSGLYQWPILHQLVQLPKDTDSCLFKNSFIPVFISCNRPCADHVPSAINYRSFTNSNRWWRGLDKHWSEKAGWQFIFRETFSSKIMICVRRLTICHLRNLTIFVWCWIILAMRGKFYLQLAVRGVFACLVFVHL